MAEVNAAVLARGAFTEQLFYRPDLVEHNDTCAQILRPLCSADSPAQSRFALFGLNSWSQTTLNLSVAEFLLARGPYGVIGVTWSGCGCGCGVPAWPELLDAGFGEPVDKASPCVESAPGVFSRAWTHADVSIDCNTPGTATPTITMH
jgi:hypothetical protein